MENSYAYGMWIAVIFNIALFLFFAFSFLIPKKRREWRSLGVFSAFIVALFAEMYGFPLTIYILTSLLGNYYPVDNPFSHINGHLWVALLGGSKLAWAFVMLISNAVIFGGFALMWKGWKQIHSAKGEMITDGIYRYLRHPQYAGLFLAIIGTMIQWPTFATVLMVPILFLVYYRLARREERDMEEQFGARYLEYRKQTPTFIPSLTKIRRNKGSKDWRGDTTVKNAV